MTLPQFVLASASPARLRLLRAVGIEPIVQPSDFDEDSLEIEAGPKLVQALATCKAEAVAASWRSAAEPMLVLGCDSLLMINGEAQGKPQDPAEAIARWQIMQGHYGDLITGHSLIDLGQGLTLSHCRTTRVHFAPVSDAEIRAYVATGEPMNCAGCFALEGRGGQFIERLEGCHSNVIGLSLPLLRQMMAELGHRLI
ncbi:MAG: septum formation inhibitor Maf [Synechococcales cyanobacterium RM1_1_8]|nr:septum formation inhibitor Maf [Synechococcales cyanobacterium RM1_1_8]